MVSIPGVTSPIPGDLAAFYRRNATYGTTDRYREATRAEAYNLGKQYVGLEAWESSAPIHQKRPKIIIPVYPETINALDAFVWSGHHRVVVGATRDPDVEVDPREIGPALLPDDAKILTRFVAAMITAGSLDRAMREATRSTLVTTSQAVILGIRGGYMTTTVQCGKDCTPTWDPIRPHALSQLEICYQFQREDPTANGGVRKRWYWYRRTIDDTNDVVYQEVPVVAGQAPNWVADPDRSVTHDLGFCPVWWLRTMPHSADVLDGTPVIDPQTYPLIDAISYAASQRNRAVAMVTDPQGIRTGVPDVDREDLKKNPGKLWDLPPGGTFEFAEPTGVGAQRAAELQADFTQCFAQACRVVRYDPKLLSGNVSGRFLEMINDPTVKLSQVLRWDFGRDGLCGIVKLGLRMIATVIARGEDVWIPGAHQAADIIERTQLAGPYLDPPVTMAWGKFFTESAIEIQARVTATAAAVTEGFISKATATRELADVFHVEDATAELADIDDEDDDRDSIPPPALDPNAPPVGVSVVDPGIDDPPSAPGPAGPPNDPNRRQAPR